MFNFLKNLYKIAFYIIDLTFFGAAIVGIVYYPLSFLCDWGAEIAATVAGIGYLGIVIFGVLSGNIWE